jgi:hypothetical protein
LIAFQECLTHRGFFDFNAVDEDLVDVSGGSTPALDTLSFLYWSG